MHKLVIILLLSSCTTFGWTYKFFNNASVKVKVILGTLGGPDYPIEINPHEVGTISTGGWCRRSIKIIALEKDKQYGSLASFNGDFACVPFIGTNCCSDQKYTIYQTIGMSGIMGPRLNLGW